MNEPVGAPIGSPDITPDDRLWAALGYPIPLISIIVLLMEDKKNRPFIRFHAVQSLALNVVIWVLIMLLSVTVILACVAPLLWFVVLWPAWTSYQGKWQELPMITNFIRGQGWV